MGAPAAASQKNTAIASNRTTRPGRTLTAASLWQRKNIREADYAPPTVTMLEAWLVFPLVLSVLSLGLGLLVDRAAGRSLPGVLLLPVGSATLVAVTSLAVLVIPSSAVITAVVAALAVFGLVLVGLRRIEPGALLAAGGVFAAFGAPVVASGSPTFAGYIKLDDTATFLALVDRALEHGRNLAGLPASSYEATLAVNLAHGYPLGSLLPLGVLHELVRIDVAWAYQPWLSWNAAMLALALFALAGPLIRRVSLRALVVFVAAQPALLYGFAMWGGVKELVAAALVATAVAAAAELRPPYWLGCLVPLGIVSAALLDAVSLAGVVWLITPLALLVPVLRRRLLAALAGAGVAAVLALPALLAMPAFYRGSNRDTFTDATELGNLAHPLHVAQIVGIWPSGDFRFAPASSTATLLLMLVAVAAAVVGVGLALKQQAWGLVLAVASAAVGATAFAALGAPWIVGKALAVGSPFVLLAAAVGAAALLSRRVPTLAAAGAAASIALVVGVGWSNGLAYHDVSLAPYSQLAELQRIGARFAGDGPTLVNEYQPYGVRHFLRRLDAEGVSELRRRPIWLSSGRLAAKGESVDIDQVRLRDLLVYRTLVLRRSPTESRPPAAYRLVWSGRWYRVWQRSQRILIVEHRPLGDALEPGARASCGLVSRLASVGRVLSYPRAVNLAWPLDRTAPPRAWSRAGGGAVIPRRSGTLSLAIGLPRSRRYRVWIGGSVRGRLTVSVDGVRIGTVEHQLQNAGQWLELGGAALSRGTHRVTIAVSLSRLSPGSGGGTFPLGPLLLEPVASSRLFEPAMPWAICGRNVDWLEARSESGG